jgi:hypothetical protein
MIFIRVSVDYGIGTMLGWGGDGHGPFDKTGLICLGIRLP